MGEWKDESSYSRSDEHPHTPTTWTIESPDLKIVVTRHIHFPGTWVLQCAAASFHHWDLKTNDVDTARAKALRLVRDRLVKISYYVDRLCEQHGVDREDR